MGLCNYKQSCPSAVHDTQINGTSHEDALDFITAATKRESGASRGGMKVGGVIPKYESLYKGSLILPTFIPPLEASKRSSTTPAHGPNRTRKNASAKRQMLGVRIAPRVQSQSAGSPSPSSDRLLVGCTKVSLGLRLDSNINPCSGSLAICKS